MKKAELEVYSEASNHAIVRVEGRRFPGCVVQGDSLSVLCSEARQLSLALQALQVRDEELLFLAQEHQEKLLGRLLHYQQVLDAHGIELPHRQVTEAELVRLLPDEPDAEDIAIR